jgi:hypothetical protein
MAELLQIVIQGCLFFFVPKSEMTQFQAPSIKTLILKLETGI